MLKQFDFSRSEYDSLDVLAVGKTDKRISVNLARFFPLFLQIASKIARKVFQIFVLLTMRDQNECGVFLLVLYILAQLRGN